MFTQPLMYKKIRSMPTVLQKYCERLIHDGTITQEEYEASNQRTPQPCLDSVPVHYFEVANFCPLCVSVTSRRARETIHAKISKIQKFDLEI